MKTVSILLFALHILAWSACTKSNNGIQLQAHDENRMMDSMHAMMTRMKAISPSNDPEIDFVKMMVMHHQGAIAMSDVELQSGRSDSLRRIAQKISMEQQQEIQQFNSLLSSLIIDNRDSAFA